jgi:hypothetical protein
MPRTEHRLFTLDVPVETERGLFNDGQFDAANERLCKVIGRKLAETYPGHPWGVISEIEHGVIKIALAGFTQWPVVIKVTTLANDPGLKSVVHYAGELLERLQMPRKGFSFADWKAASARLPWHLTRNHKAPE